MGPEACGDGEAWPTRFWWMGRASMTPKSSAQARVPLLDPSRRRLVLTALVGTAVGLTLPDGFGGMLRAVAIWDAVGLTLLALRWEAILHATPESTRARAAREDPARAAVLARILTSGVGSLVVAVLLLRAQGPGVGGREEVLVDILALLAVVNAWALTHTYYALHYAHLYYERGGGLDFPGEAPPADMDFVYFALAIGTSYAGSDVTVTSPAIRRAVVGHAALSFAYNTTLLALALGFVAAQL